MLQMDSYTQFKADTITKVVAGKISPADASKLLNKSVRTIERYVEKNLREGLAFIIHKNRNRSPVNKIPIFLKKRVQALIQNKYFDYNLTHFREKLEEDENILVRRETLRRWAHEIGHVKRAKRKRAKVRKRRSRMVSCGLMAQMDGSTHRWFGDRKTCLILLIDDANSEIHGEFFESETTVGCMKVLKEFISKKGIFKTLYVDRAGIFGGPKRCHFSQVQRACEELGINIIFAHSPQGKGRVERAFNTLQDRLIPELRQQGIKTMSGVNSFLRKKFIPPIFGRGRSWFSQRI